MPPSSETRYLNRKNHNFFRYQMITFLKDWFQESSQDILPSQRLNITLIQKVHFIIIDYVSTNWQQRLGHELLGDLYFSGKLQPHTVGIFVRLFWLGFEEQISFHDHAGTHALIMVSVSVIKPQLGGCLAANISKTSLFFGGKW